MPERCPICDTELYMPGYYCPKCRRSVEAELLKSQIAIMEEAITGWRAENERLKAKLEAYWQIVAELADIELGWPCRLCGQDAEHSTGCLWVRATLEMAFEDARAAEKDHA